MSIKSIAKKVALGGITGIAATALVFTGTSASFANPDTTPRDINVFGSDTTQDVMNGVAKNAKTGTGTGSAYIGSWNAGTTDAASPLNPAPNGSGAGVTALKLALNNDPAYVGKIQGARSSSAPKDGDLDVNGGMQYIPFARDAVTYATASNSLVPSGIPLTATGTGLSLERIFKCASGTWDFQSKKYYTVGTPTDPNAIKLEPVNLQADSGTRSFWAGAVGYSGTCLSGDEQEHNGEYIQASQYRLAPFSISQWIAQSNVENKLDGLGAPFPNQQAIEAQEGIEGDLAGIRVVDRRYGVKLNNVGSELTTSNPTEIVSGKTVQNPDFVSALTRDVYNVIPTDAVLNPTASSVNILLNEAFVGSGADAYDSTVIEAFGFSTALKGTHAVGSTPIELRVKI